jgi:hypothetical protein
LSQVKTSAGLPSLLVHQISSSYQFLATRNGQSAKVGSPKIGRYAQPRIHKMQSIRASFVEDGVHGYFPKTWDLGLTITYTRERETVVCETVVERVWPGYAIREYDR